MQPGIPPRGRAAVAALVAMVLACALAAPGSASAAPPRPGAGDLSARLAELAEPAVRSAAPSKQADELSLPPSGPGSLLRDGNRVLVEVRFARGAAESVRDLRATGVEIVNVSRAYETVTVAAKPQQLQRLASAPRVASITEVLRPLVHATASSSPVTSATTPCLGAATSEGDTQLEASKARAEFEVDGAGVEVGVLSDSFDRNTATATDAAADVASGDLPGPGNACGRDSAVDTLDDSVEGSDEGRAMAQIIHDLAPGAEISFATAFKSLTAFADNIKALASNGADVIVDDVSYFEEPFFQEGPVGLAVTEVTEGGASYFSSAGNNNLIDAGDNIASWETPAFRDSGACPAELVTVSEELEAVFGPTAGLNPAHCLDFDPGLGDDTNFGITVSSGTTLNVDLQWAEPWRGVETDIDVFLFDGGGNLLAESFDDNASVGGTQKPFEFLGWENDSGGPMQVQLVVNRYDGELPRTKFALLQNGGGVPSTEYPQGAEGDVVGPTIFGHNGAADAMSVGAISFDASEAPESFSSRGPVTHYFEPVDGITPAEPLLEPTELAKPDITATDGGANTFFGACSLGAWRFFGTSAAAPHAAAIAALQRQADAAATAEEVAQAQRDSGSAIGLFPPTAIGSGLLSAIGAIEALGVSATSPGATAAEPPTPVSCLSSEPDPEPDPQPVPPPPIVVASPPPPPADAAPQTFFQRKPPGVVRTRGRARRVAFRFGSNERGVIFLCQFDRKRYRICPQRFARRFRLGRHALRVKARDTAGNVDPKPAVSRFRVKRSGRNGRAPSRGNARHHRAR